MQTKGHTAPLFFPSSYNSATNFSLLLYHTFCTSILLQFVCLITTRFCVKTSVVLIDQHQQHKKATFHQNLLAFLSFHKTTGNMVDINIQSYELHYFPIHALDAASRAILSLAGADWKERVQQFEVQPCRNKGVCSHLPSHPRPTFTCAHCLF